MAEKKNCFTVTKKNLEVFYKKAILKNFANFKEKHLCWSLFLIKLHAFYRTSFLKKALYEVKASGLQLSFNIFR